MRNLLNTLYVFYVRNVLDGWGETRVNCEFGVVYYGGNRQVVEDVGNVLPDSGATVFALTLSVEAVDLCYLAGFVVAAEQSNSVGIS